MNPIKKELALFVPVTLAITYGIGLFLWKIGGNENVSMRIVMYIPALATMILYLTIFHRPVLRGNDLGLRFCGWKYWIIAPAVMLALSLTSYAVSYLFNPDMFSGADAIRENLSAKGFYWGGLLPGIIAVFLLNGIAGSIMNIPMFLGEEIGWRGFMVPRLLALLTPQKAFFTGGAIWALWHAVLIARGLNYPGHPVVGIFMMILFAIPVGIIIQYYYFRSKSIFVAALAHASLNKSAMSMSFLLTGDQYNTFLFGPTGVVGIILFFAVAIYLFKKIDWKSENPLMGFSDLRRNAIKTVN
jgi:membrane protease YdiL (CAAX protease family)